jgi:RHS repeat-associated protein
LDRNGIGSELEMDRFIYNYHTLNGEQSNRLNYVVDNGIDYSSYDDIKSGQTSGNYTYNKIGELVSDNSENMILHWRTGDHKLARIERTDENSPELEFVYNPFGQRVMKIEKIRANGVLTGEVKNSYYAYDANSLSRCIHSSLTLFRRSNVTIGRQVMAIYEINLDNEIYKLKERNIYGAERLGVNNTEVTIFENNTLTEFIHKETNVVHVDIRGRKRYFLTNHLGTVNATITDRKIYNTTDHYYEPVIVMYAETYCFGFLMPNRSFNLEESRYLLHGMEYDSEVSGTGNSYTTEFRQFDPRLGRWKSLDPLMHMFPHVSPYVAFANNPIYFTDPYGLEPVNDDENKTENNTHDNGVKPGGLPEHSENGKIYKADDGKRYQGREDGGFTRLTDDVVVTPSVKQKLDSQPRDITPPNTLPTDRYSNYDPYREKLPLKNSTSLSLEGEGNQDRSGGLRLTGAEGSSTSGTKDKTKTDVESYDGSTFGHNAVQQWKWLMFHGTGGDDDGNGNGKNETNWTEWPGNSNYQYKKKEGIHIIRANNLGDTIYERTLDPNVQCKDCRQPSNRNKSFGNITIKNYEQDGSTNRDEGIKYK